MSLVLVSYVDQHFSWPYIPLCSSGSLGFTMCVKCCRMVDSVPIWQLSLSWPIRSDHVLIADRMIPPSGREHCHGKTQYIPGKQVLERNRDLEQSRSIWGKSWQWKLYYLLPLYVPGTYICHSFHVFQVLLFYCHFLGKSGLLLDSMDSQRLSQLSRLETSKTSYKVQTEDVEITKPVFTTALKNISGASENSTVHLECRLEPVNDPNLRVEW